MCYLHEDMHALLVYIYKPVKGGFRILDGNLRVLSYMVVAPWIALYAFACIMPACMHAHTPRHFIDRNALWDTCHKFGRLIPPMKSHRILLNYRGK